MRPFESSAILDMDRKCVTINTWPTSRLMNILEFLPESGKWI